MKPNLSVFDTYFQSLPYPPPPSTPSNSHSPLSHTPSPPPPSPLLQTLTPHFPTHPHPHPPLHSIKPSLPTFPHTLAPPPPLSTPSNPHSPLTHTPSPPHPPPLLQTLTPHLPTPPTPISSIQRAGNIKLISVIPYAIFGSRAVDGNSSDTRHDEGEIIAPFLCTQSEISYGDTEDFLWRYAWVYQWLCCTLYYK